MIAEAAPAELVSHAMQSLKSDEHAYDQHFQLLNEETGRPLSNRRYKISYSGGVLESTTDGDGFTCKVSAAAPEKVIIEIYDLEHSAINKNWDK